MKIIISKNKFKNKVLKKKKKNYIIIFFYIFLFWLWWLLAYFLFNGSYYNNILDKQKNKPKNKTNFNHIIKNINNFIFNSSFDSGNLNNVFLYNETYYLKIGNDYDYTKKNNTDSKNWFNFSITNYSNELKNITFVIDNLKSNYSMWKNGFSPVFKSNLTKEWKYWENNINIFYDKKFLKLELSYNFEKFEKINIALSYPYSLKKYNKMINILERSYKNDKDIYFKKSVIIKSNEGNNIDLIYFTDKSNILKKKYPVIKNLFNNKDPDIHLVKKKTCKIALSARVHPSETASSYIIESIMKKLLDKTNDVSKNLLKKCLFIIFPMLNPDGVSYGNTRFDLNGINLNANYRFADLNTPSIYALKKFLRFENQKKKLLLYIDFHSHLTKRDIFFFGNPLKKSNYGKILEVPYYFYNNEIDRKKLIKRSKFGSNRLESTSRKDLYKYLKINSIYTFEINYWGKFKSLKYLKRHKKIMTNNLRIIDKNDKLAFYKIKDFIDLSNNFLQLFFNVVNNKTILIENYLKEYYNMKKNN